MRNDNKIHIPDLLADAERRVRINAGENMYYTASVVLELTTTIVQLEMENKELKNSLLRIRGIAEDSL